jgi:calcium-dependent protein kinase
MVVTHTQGHPRDDYEITEHLGDGDTSSCWRGSRESDGRTHQHDVAIKAEFKSDEVWIWEEIDLLRTLNHPNIVKLQATYEDDNQIFMVLEICEGGKLYDAVHAEKDGCRVASKSGRLMRQLADAVSHLHGKRIAHRDVQLENFLITKKGSLEQANVKLIDFTTAKNFANGVEMKTKICTPSYVAPEILKRTMDPYTEKVDIWSLGVVFFIMLCGQPPFFGTGDFDTLKLVKKGTFKFEPTEVWEKVPEPATDLVRKMIVKVVSDRFSAAEVVQHAWLV